MQDAEKEEVATLWLQNNGLRLYKDNSMRWIKKPPDIITIQDIIDSLDKRGKPIAIRLLSSCGIDFDVLENGWGDSKVFIFYATDEQLIEFEEYLYRENLIGRFTDEFLP